MKRLGNTTHLTTHRPTRVEEPRQQGMKCHGSPATHTPRERTSRGELGWWQGLFVRMENDRQGRASTYKKERQTKRTSTHRKIGKGAERTLNGRSQGRQRATKVATHATQLKRSLDATRGSRTAA